MAAQLVKLGHPPDLLTADAVQALVEHASGSPAKLRAGLASTLFLASTEDAPRVGVAHVRRALQDGVDEPPALPVLKVPRRPAATRPPSILRVLAGPVIALMAVVLLPVYALHKAARLQPPLPLIPPAPAVTMPVSSTPPIADAPAATPARVTMPGVQPSPPAAAPLPALPAAIELRTPPAPPTAVPLPAVRPAHALTPVRLPSSPPATVLLFFPARDASEPARLASLMHRLRQAGIGNIETRLGRMADARRPVSYFFADDRALAQTVTAILASEGWPRIIGNSLAPRLVLPPAGLPSEQPGLIEIQLP